MSIPTRQRLLFGLIVSAVCVALGSHVALGCSAKSCPDYTICDNNARFTVTLPSPSTPDLEVTVCVNGSCYSPTTCDWKASDGWPPATVCSVDDAGQISTISVYVDRAPGVDGDVYEIRVTVPGSADPVFDWQQAVTYYVDSSDSCTGPCKYLSMNVP